jgi:hypothetical protein
MCEYDALVRDEFLAKAPLLLGALPERGRRVGQALGLDAAESKWWRSGKGSIVKSESTALRRWIG